MEPQILAPHLPFMRRRDMLYEQIVAGLKVNDKSEIVYNDTHRLFVRKVPGFVTTPTFSNCSIKDEVV